MSQTILTPEPLTRDAFSPYGDVIELETHTDIMQINYGLTHRYHDLAELDVTQGQGRPLFNIFKSNPVELPFKVQVIERHPFSSQLFFPLGNTPYLVLVAHEQSELEKYDLKLFMTNGAQGINYYKNTWHHYLLSLNKTSDFIVIDRGGPEKNCEEFFLDKPVLIESFEI